MIPVGMTNVLGLCSILKRYRKDEVYFYSEWVYNVYNNGKSVKR